MMLVPRPPDFVCSGRSRGSFSKGRDGAMAAVVLGQLQITQHCAADAYSQRLQIGVLRGPQFGGPQLTAHECSLSEIGLKISGGLARVAGLTGGDFFAATVTSGPKFAGRCPAASVTARPLPGRTSAFDSLRVGFVLYQSHRGKLTSPPCLFRRRQFDAMGLADLHQRKQPMCLALVGLAGPARARLIGGPRVRVGGAASCLVGDECGGCEVEVAMGRPGHFQPTHSLAIGQAEFGCRNE